MEKLQFGKFEFKAVMISMANTTSICTDLQKRTDSTG